MLSFKSVGQAIDDRRNWPIMALAGALVFLGSQIFEALGLDSAAWMIALIVIIALAARPFIRSSPSG
jgi:hypothetical protein